MRFHTLTKVRNLSIYWQLEHINALTRPVCVYVCASVCKWVTDNAKWDIVQWESTLKCHLKQRLDPDVCACVCVVGTGHHGIRMVQLLPTLLQNCLVKWQKDSGILVTLWVLISCSTLHEEHVDYREKILWINASWERPKIVSVMHHDSLLSSRWRWRFWFCRFTAGSSYCHAKNVQWAHKQWTFCVLLDEEKECFENCSTIIRRNLSKGDHHKEFWILFKIHQEYFESVNVAEWWLVSCISRTSIIP